MPTDLFYNTGISTYIWLLSKNKRPERKGFVQLIDASSFCHKLRKPLGNKKNEFLPEDRQKICDLYTSFEENEYCKIFPNTEFIYKEYAVMQPLQRSYSITEESIDAMIRSGALSSLYDPAKVAELEAQGTSISKKDEDKLAQYMASMPVYDSVLLKLKENVSDKKWMSPESFAPVLKSILPNLDKKLLDKISDGLSIMDKEAEIQRDKKGNIIYDKETKDTELVKWDEDIEDYMAREVLPHVPDAKWFFEENLAAKKPVIKTGAEIPFTRYFYKYQAPTPSEELMKQFIELEKSVSSRIAKLIGGEA